jgi:DNA polymerase mu
LRTLEDLTGPRGPPLSEIVRVSLPLTEQLLQPMPREEALTLAAAVVTSAVEPVAAQLRRPLETLVAGGLRRGKTVTKDIDLMIRCPAPPRPGEQHSEAELEPYAILQDVATQLERSGLLLHTLGRADEQPPNLPMGVAPPSAAARGLLVPGRGTHPRLMVIVQSRRAGALPRRLDLTVIPHQDWAAAVLGWSGSTMFERALRLYATRHGFALSNHGLTRAGEPLSAHSEAEIFAHLGLAYVPPELRNL